MKVPFSLHLTLSMNCDSKSESFSKEKTEISKGNQIFKLTFFSTLCYGEILHLKVYMLVRKFQMAFTYFLIHFIKCHNIP